MRRFKFTAIVDDEEATDESVAQIKKIYETEVLTAGGYVIAFVIESIEELPCASQ